jgi:hypothetical protein
MGAGKADADNDDEDEDEKGRRDHATSSPAVLRTGPREEGPKDIWLYRPNRNRMDVDDRCSMTMVKQASDFLVPVSNCQFGTIIVCTAKSANRFFGSSC